MHTTVARIHGAYSETLIQVLLNLAIQSECYNNYCTTGLILERGLAGFPQFGKKIAA